MVLDLRNIGILQLLSYIIRRLAFSTIAFLIFSINSHAYSYLSEDKIKAFIIGKAAKYVTWKNIKENTFKITIVGDAEFGSLVSDIYFGKKIKNRNVEVIHIDSIDNLNTTHVLFIPEVSYSVLKKTLQKVEGKNVLTISDSRGFAEKNGIIQIYTSSQKNKLKINYTKSKKESLKISSSLLKIAQIVESKVENATD